MPLSRLVRYFKSSRDSWKNKALEKQRKLRGFEQKIRDLEKSRQQWREKAKKAEEKAKELEKKLEKLHEKPENLSKFRKGAEARAICHHYSIQTIQMSVQQVIEGGNSYRSIAKIMKLLSENFEVNSPHYSSIRKWVGRVGLYELYRKKAYRDDWIFIVDLTLELGQEKAMIVYGISQEKTQKILAQEQRALKHTDGEILAIEVTKKATGEFIQEKLEQLSNKVGIPEQILADYGSNLKKGIQLYQKNHPNVIYTYDVTHAMSNLLKQELRQDKTYQKFLSDCHKCRLELQQTELAFLSPPSQRSQCRYFNIERLVNWGEKLLNTSLEVIVPLMPQKECKICYQRLKQKFFWLIHYEEPLLRWKTMVFLTRSLETQLKCEGLNQQSLKKFEKHINSLKLPSDLLEFQQQIIKYISQEIAGLKTEKTLLATTDVLESIFGKYKQFSGRCPLKDFRQMLLTIPLFTMTFTTDVFKNALETIRGIDLEEWVDQIFGQSMLSKRKILFLATSSDIESA